MERQKHLQEHEAHTSHPYLSPKTNNKLKLYTCRVALIKGNQKREFSKCSKICSFLESVM
ncbi:unnamed protein product [Brassica oleracea var. botrytis]